MSMAEEQGHTGGSQSSAPNAGPTSTAVHGRLVSRLLLWRQHDLGFAASRRALRAAIVIPLAMAFALLVFHHAQATINVALGCFALLVLADFGGLRRPRAAAYLGTTLVGLVLVTLGTLASGNPWVGASAMLVVGFVVPFAGVFGGYIAAAESALLLIFVLSVSVPAPPTAIPTRVLGWGIAGVVSTLASVLLWPQFERSTMRSQAAAFNEILDLGTTEAFLQAQGRAMRTAEREGEAFDQYVRERASRPLAPQIASALGVAGRSALVAGNHLHALADRGYRAQLQTPADCEASLLGQVRTLTAAYAQLGNQLDQASTGQPHGQQVNEAVLQAAMLDALRRWKEDPGAEQAAVAIIAGGLWIRDLAVLAADQEEAVLKVIEAAVMPWWR